MNNLIKLLSSIFIGILTSCTSQTNLVNNAKDFKNKYDDFSVKAEELYNIKNNKISESIVDSNDLNMKIVYEFELMNDTIMCFVQNNLTHFYNKNDLKLGWKLGQRSFWNGLLSKETNKSDFTFFKNSQIYSIGDYSEYSELPIGTDNLIIAYHVKLNNLIIHYGYLILQSEKEELMRKLMKKIEKIKNEG